MNLAGMVNNKNTFNPIYRSTYTEEYVLLCSNYIHEKKKSN